MTSEDHCAHRASDYSRYRPHYPSDLFEYLADLAPTREVAWDCGTGNGQAAVGLAAFFDRVIGSDSSAGQLADAKQHPRVEYVCSEAGQSPCDSRSADLITAAAAAHWFDLDSFYGEVRRVAKPCTVVALWCYGLFSVDSDVDYLMETFAGSIVGPYWPKERSHVDAAYKTLPFPFSELSPPPFQIEEDWTLDRLVGYLRTWSSVDRFREAIGEDPVEQIMDTLERFWGDTSRVRRITWPVHMRVGRAGSEDR